MIGTLVPRVPERQAPAPDRTPRLEQLATLRRENAALWAEKRGPAGREWRAARADPRAGSPAGADLGQLLAAAVVGPTPGAGAPESIAIGAQTRRPTGPSRRAPRP